MQDLIQEIKEAFADVPYPGHSNIGTDEHIVAFRGLHWNDVPLEILFLRRFEITSFTPGAFHFYLPAMLIGILLHHEELDTLPGTLVDSLAPQKDEGWGGQAWNKKLQQIIQLLNPQQRKIIHKFLIKCEELYPTEGWDRSEEELEELRERIRFWERS